MFYKQRVLANFEVEKTARIVPAASAEVHVTTLSAYEMSDKQFVYADHAVFSTSKVC